MPRPNDKNPRRFSRYELNNTGVRAKNNAINPGLQGMTMAPKKNPYPNAVRDGERDWGGSMMGIWENTVGLITRALPMIAVAVPL